MSRKDDILDSAETLARSHGFDGFSYADIEREVGIRKASIHFASKQALALALVERYRENFAITLAEIATPDASAGDRLKAFLDVYKVALSGGATVCLCVSLSASRQSLNDDVVDAVNHFHADVLAWLEETFAHGRSDGSINGVASPAAEASATLALVEGAQLMAHAARDPSTFEVAVAGLRARAP